MTSANTPSAIATWLAFALIALVIGAALAGGLIAAMRMQPAWAIIAATPIALFLAAMFALVFPLQRTIAGLIARLLGGRPHDAE